MNTKAKILVVDDEPGMLRAVERILAPEHAVTTVASPIEALEIAGTMHPDVVICDISMPRMDGFEVMVAPEGSPPRRGCDHHDGAVRAGCAARFEQSASERFTSSRSRSTAT
jgi:CheY-like chemotaxis protein